MKLNNIWGYGQLFGYSALEGPNRYYEDNILMTMKKKLSFRFEFKKYIKLTFDTNEKIKFKAVMSDFVEALINNKEFFFTFLDNDTLVGISPILPTFKGEKKLAISEDLGVTIYWLDNHFLGFKYIRENDLYRFVIHHSFSLSEARSGANHYLMEFNIEDLKEKRYTYYQKIEKCRDKKYEKLYYKALSINKVNVRSPEGKIQRLWTTPDRVPHRHMWMWDTAFHALAMVQYNQKVAQEIFLAMLETIRNNGFMPHMANPTDQSDVTQPCVMAWAAYNIYQKTKDLEFLKTATPYLEKYLTFDLLNRDKNHNNLLEWYVETNYANCRCGESGLDNSPRFDFDEDMDAIDFSSYFANDCYYLAKIYEEIKNNELADKWRKQANLTSQAINEKMYDKNDGVYYDYLFSNKLTKVLTQSSFLPLFVGIMNKNDIDKMVEKLIDKTELWSINPIASISQKDNRFSNDMWRGGVWLNLNYFIICGLRKYGKIEVANKLKDATLKMVDKWYKKTGTIFEFYDPKDEVSPFKCLRKGPQPKTPDYRTHVHSISDYNWSACFTILLIQDIYY